MSDQFRDGERSDPRDRRLRVGNHEREAVADILRREHLAGRLDSSEFDERLERCLTAKTYGDLDGLVADFPPPEGERRQPARPAWRWRPWPFLVVPLFVLAVVFSDGRATWLLVPLLFWFVVRPFSWGYGRRCGPPLGRRI